MNNKLFLLFVAFTVITTQAIAQSVEEQANRIGLVGFWKMTEMSGFSEGEKFSQELDGSNFYIFKNDGTCQYTKNERKIAIAKWTLKGDELHIWGNDIANDPDGIDYTFTLVMVTPQKLVLKLGDDEEYVYTTFRKSNATLKPVGSSTKKRTQTRKK